MKQFFAVIYSICTGTSMFPSFLYIPLRKTLGYAFLLSLLSALAVVLAFGLSEKKNVAAFAEAFERTTGEFEVTSSEILIQNNDRTSKSVAVGRHIQFDYYQSSSEINVESLRRAFRNKGVVVSPHVAFMWQRDNSKFIIPAIMIHSKVDPDLLAGTVRLDELQELIAASLEKKADEPLWISYPFANINVKDQERQLAGTSSRMIFSPEHFSALFIAFLIFWSGFVFIMISLGLLISSLFFAGIIVLTRRESFKGVPFASVFNVAVFTGVPAIVIATLFKCFVPQYFSYGEIFLICYCVYFGSVVARVQYHLLAIDQVSAD